MSDYELRTYELPNGGIGVAVEFDFLSMVDEYAERIERNATAAVLDKAAPTLAEFGYAKVVRCKDCRWCMAYSKATYCDQFAHKLPGVALDGFCAWGERRGE